MKKQKLRTLKVSSFKTSISDLNQRTIKGKQRDDLGHAEYINVKSTPCVGIFSEVPAALAWQQTIAVTC